jgi:hypothetical protein
VADHDLRLLEDNYKRNPAVVSDGRFKELRGYNLIRRK